MSNRKRITFVLAGRGLAGGVRVVVQYANLLRERGHEVSIVSERAPYPRKLGSLVRRVRADACALLGVARDHVDDFTGHLIVAPARGLAQRVPDGDVVIATYWTTAGTVHALPERCGEKMYFLQHYEAHSSDPAAVDATWRLPMRKIVIARWLEALARERFGDTTAVLVPNGVDTAQFDAAPRGLHEPPCVGFMYSSAPWKGTAGAIEAARRARDIIPNLRAVSFGHRRPDAALPLPPDFEFHWRPPQTRIRDIYASADVWLCASTTEGFALPPLEAMACRCPVVCTRCGGPEDFVVEGRNGFLIDVGDAVAMAERIATLLRDPELHSRMSDAAYETRLAYTWEKAVTRFEAALLGCTDTKSAATGQAERGAPASAESA